MLVADAVIPELERLGDDVGLAKAWWLRSEADSIACRWGKRAEALERALVHARAARAGTTPPPMSASLRKRSTTARHPSTRLSTGARRCSRRARGTAPSRPHWRARSPACTRCAASSTTRGASGTAPQRSTTSSGSDRDGRTGHSWAERSRFWRATTPPPNRNFASGTTRWRRSVNGPSDRPWPPFSRGPWWPRANCPKPTSTRASARKPQARTTSSRSAAGGRPEPRCSRPATRQQTPRRPRESQSGSPTRPTSSTCRRTRA